MSSPGLGEIDGKMILTGNLGLSLKEFEMTAITISEVQTTQNEPEREQPISTFKFTQVIWLLLSLFEALLALRFVLNLREDKPVTPFGAVLYCFTGFFRLRIFQM
jgi:hypothetical protein